MPSSSGSKDEDTNISNSPTSQSSAASGGFLGMKKKHRSFGLKKTPFKPKIGGRIRSGGKKSDIATTATVTANDNKAERGLSQLLEAQQLQLDTQLAKINESGSTSTSQQQSISSPLSIGLAISNSDIASPSPSSNKDQQDSAFLKALRGSNSMDEEDAGIIDDNSSQQQQQNDAFLKAIQGNTSSSNNHHQPQSTTGRVSPMSNADTDFLAAMRGSTPPLSSLQSAPSWGGGSVSSMEASPSHQREPLRSEFASRLPIIKSSDNLNEFDNDDESKEGGTTKKKTNDVDNANAAFLGALHASSIPNDGGEGGTTTKSYPDGSFIMSSPPISKMQKAKQRLAGQQAAKNYQQYQQQQSVNTDSEFLMAVRGSQFTSSQSSSTTSFAGGNDYDSGTLVLDSKDIKKAGGDNADFMMSIQSSADDNNGEESKTALDNEKADTTKQSKVTEREEEIEDEDIEGLTLPIQPYMEKVLLPRPLFFGHHLSPRITAEAERAASLYNTPPDMLESEDKEETATAAAAKETISPERTLTSVDSESSVADDGSVLSSRSLSSLAAGGRTLESSVAPSCRNFEGAIEAFGFGVNPFTSNCSADTQHEVDDNNDNIQGAQPYVSLYSPVWEEWQTAARAKARRKKGRLLDKQAAAVEEAKAKLQASPRRKHKKTTSIDFFSLDKSSEDVEQNQKTKDSSHTIDTAASPISESTETPKEAPQPQDNSANNFSQDMFLQYARAGSVNGVDNSSNGDATSTSSPITTQEDSTSSDFSQDQFLKYARAGSVDDDTTNVGGSGTFIGAPKSLPEINNSDNNFSQDMFLQYARGGSISSGGAGTFVSSKPNKKSPPMDSSTFVQAVKSSDDGDDDEIVATEERRGVGLNDNISAAAAMLAGNGGDDDEDADVTRGIDTSMFLAAGGGAKSANKYGRPYSNFELTGGCTPQFGCDDPSLPHESDLGMFETKDEEKRSAERRRERNMIEDFAVPGIMPHITCPTHCSDVDDCTSYNSRFAESDSAGKNNTTLISLDGSTYPDNGASAQLHKSPTYEVKRIAWWNLPDSYDWTTSNAASDGGKESSGGSSPGSVAEVFPALDEPIPLDVETNLWPSQNLLRENNMSGSRSHSATSTARFLPHLSDRAPSDRHLQIDTTAVGFPKLGGEIEPMFCKLAIYHFEMGSEKMSHHTVESDSVSTNATSTPAPNMERCGRVTESLSFDIVQDPRVIQKCKDALWPYASDEQNDNNAVLPQTEGTSCGMFPLPANMSISNLYAVIVVDKVVAESEDLKPYYKPSRHEQNTNEEFDLATLRANAAKACEDSGQFTTPFAFGVVPLKHIIGEESPKVPVSRAVQIPLFKFDPERGPQSIFDHILLMLHPRAEPRGGKTASMTRGHALLVMRYFGFLGLHSILKKKSSLARERLVDFQGELQLKCASDDDARYNNRHKRKKCPTLGETYKLPPWRSQYEVEPAPSGGRNVSEPMKRKTQGKGTPKSLYAQEIAAIPLKRSIPESSSRSSSRKSTNRSKYDGMLLHTNFCNELVCQPKMIHKCPKENTLIKVELRELQWDDTLKTEVALPVAASIHNTRRGPWLVQEAYTSCAMGAPYYLDDFKIKLPLILDSTGLKRYGLLFTVYHLKAKKKRRSVIMSVSKQSDGTAGKSESGYTLVQLGSGFLPLALDNWKVRLYHLSFIFIHCKRASSSPTCLIPNGDHDVPIDYNAVRLGDDIDKSNSPSSGRKHNKRLSLGSSSDTTREILMSKLEEELAPPLYTDENYPPGSLAMDRMPQTLQADDDTAEDDRSAVDDASSTGGSIQRIRTAISTGDLQSLLNSESSPCVSGMILRVTTIAFTSVHPQNKTLAELFQTKPMPPRCLVASDFSEAYALWGKARSEILYRLRPERIPPFMFVGGYLAETERKLLDPVVSLTKSSKCPHSDLMTHLIRVVAQLWRTAVTGAGEPSILWASPDSLIPLRLNAFATLLHTVSSAAHHMSKAGLRQLDGNATWDITALGRILSMVFDEWAIFGGPLEKPLHVKPPSPIKPSIKKPSIISNRAKTADVSSGLSRPSIVQRYSSQDESPKISLTKKFDVDAMLAGTLPPNLSTSAAAPEQGFISDDTTNLTSGEAGFAVDNKSDFMSALKATLDSTSETSDAEKPLLAQGPAANRRRWNTLPLNALATIQEGDTEDLRTNSEREPPVPLSSSMKDSSMDSELVLYPSEKKKKSKQMRVPQVKPADDNGEQSMSSFIDNLVLPTEKEQKNEVNDNPAKDPNKLRTLPTDDKDIETAGTAFLDAISKSMGFGQGLSGKEVGGEERRVGAAHHRKTRSRCSIDWTLPPTDKLIEKDQQIEELNRNRSGIVSQPILPMSPIGSYPDGSISDDDTTGNDSSIDGSASREVAENTSDTPLNEQQSKKEHPLKRHQRSISSSETKSIEPVQLSDYADRISDMKNNGDEIRWWPYVYEIIIYQWVALLEEQTKKGDSKKSEDPKSPDPTVGLSPIVIKYLSHAAKAARGATIRCAPFLLEIIKQSLSWRVDCVFRERKKQKPSLSETRCDHIVTPLIKLDESLMSAIEKLITMLTDASIDRKVRVCVVLFRNFDSFEYRKISIDVNTAVVRFIRDLFSILDVQLVHKLVLIYFSRFVLKEGKHWHDRDSKVTGLRCSWETTKLRLNAITVFVRFPGFLTVCSPILDSWALPVQSSPDSARRFFSDALEKINRLGLSDFTTSDGPVRKEPLTIPRMKPHWLAELCTDICLSATGHAEEKIQIRASSLLFELFWRHSQQGRFKGNISVVASVFVPFLAKILSHMDYLSNLPAKGQLRKDILPCTLFVLQSAPTGLLRALWRKLAKRSEGKSLRRDSGDRYGGIIGSASVINNADVTSFLTGSQINDDFEVDEEANIFDMFGLLNLQLSTIEYEGSSNGAEESNAEYDEKSLWRREYLLSSNAKTIANPRRTAFNNYQSGHGVGGEDESTNEPNTTNSRRWHAHDCSMVIINICRQIVREILTMLKPNLSSIEEEEDGEWGSNYAGVTGSRSMSDIFLQPTASSIDDNDPSNFEGAAQYVEGKAARTRKRMRKRKLEQLSFAVTDTIVFVRAATSVYLHALSMKQSDVVITKTLTAAVEIVKIFGIKLFLTAVGETLQHWMRVILEHCGARRAELRVDACEFLNLILRLTWDSYGSFTRVRLPLLAVQSEVMERIVSKAARKYVAEQQRLGLTPVQLSNDSAEASLTPLWRTIDRLHNQSASSNLSFKSALARLALKMKKVYRAYLAAHALAIVSRSESGSNGGDVVASYPNPYVQRMRVSVHRIVSNSTWFSKRFLGNQTSVLLDRSMVQTEAVEDSFLIAADVFSSTELPSHRVAWLQKLAEFHRMRGRFAEEATCRCNIYHTYSEAAKQHDHIWSSSPFLPWTSNLDGTHPSGEGHAIVSDYDYGEENASGGSEKQERVTSFRRIFYRASDSVRVRSGDWTAISGGKYLFYGVTLKSEFDSISPWYSHREMEENMVEEAETSGELYLRAGIVESSRYAWSLANQFYSETFNYARLAFVYRKLALVVTSQVPIIDVSNQLDLSSQIGRFYKVYFHGGAPDDLLHSQGSEGFIYRVPNSVQIKDFAARLESAIRCILPSKTTIDLLLDDGSPTMSSKTTGGKRSTVIGGAPSEPVKIKVTPLRPLSKIEDNEKAFRGTPEWFQVKADDQGYDANVEGSGRTSIGTSLSTLHQRTLSTSTTNSLSSAGSFATSSRRTLGNRSSYRRSSTTHQNLKLEDGNGVNGELIGVDRFYFTQPMKKDPVRGFRDWLKVPKGRIAERSLRVTELQVENSFPSCITRQKIIHRAVFTQSPLEASVEAVSTWCSVLFRTVTATNGQGVLVGQKHQGLTADSAKLVMECIHSSGVKRIGIIFLAVSAPTEDPNAGSGMYSPYETLSEEEIERVQTKLARMIVTFLELLHLLIARNRDVLLTVVQARKRKGGGDASSVASGSIHGYASAPRASSTFSPLKRQSLEGSVYERTSSELVGRSIVAEGHVGHVSNASDRTDSAIGVQSELQRGLISLVKALSSNLLDTLNNEVPRWMRSCCQDNYFSSGLYRQADIPIGDELFFNVDTSGDDNDDDSILPRSIGTRSIRSSHHYKENSPNGSLCSGYQSIHEYAGSRTVSSERERPPTSHRRTTSGASYVSTRSLRGL